MDLVNRIGGLNVYIIFTDASVFPAARVPDVCVCVCSFSWSFVKCWAEINEYTVEDMPDFVVVLVLLDYK